MGLPPFFSDLFHYFRIQLNGNPTRLAHRVISGAQPLFISFNLYFKLLCYVQRRWKEIIVVVVVVFYCCC